MVKRVCPICEQAMPGRHYCPVCRSFVKHPRVMDVDYFLNERHPAGEGNCEYHDPAFMKMSSSGRGKAGAGTAARPGTTAARSGTAAPWPGSAGSRPGAAAARPGTAAASWPGSAGSRPDATAARPGTAANSWPGSADTRPDAANPRKSGQAGTGSWQASGTLRGSAPGQGTFRYGQTGNGSREKRPGNVTAVVIAIIVIIAFINMVLPFLAFAL